MLPRHFFPPLLVNTALGALLFTSYTNISSTLTAHSPNMSTTSECARVSRFVRHLTSQQRAAAAAISGAGAGAIQAVVGAPAENVRVLMEQGVFRSQTSVSGWRHAWKEVFLDTRNPWTPRDAVPVKMRLSDARGAQAFAKELREMAGRGMFAVRQ